ncbi:MAG: hypothetical protein IJ087_01140 [Eggerthellaceae bacterium]|nr:hypothetical protein [Eggerthellaceae bacterium]
MRERFGHTDSTRVALALCLALALALLAMTAGVSYATSKGHEAQELKRTADLSLQAARLAGNGVGGIDPIVICAGDGLEIRVTSLGDGPIEYVGGTTTIRIDLQIENQGDKAVAARGEQWSGVDVSGNEALPTWMTFGAGSETGGHAYRQVLIDVGEVFDGTVFLKADGPISQLRYTPYVPVGNQPGPVTVDVSSLKIGHERRPR